MQSPLRAQLALNENAMPISTQVYSAIAAATSTLCRYPEIKQQSLKEQLAVYYGLHTTQVVIGNGSEAILELLCQTFANIDGNAIIFDYSYITIPTILNNHRIPVRSAPNHYFRPNSEALLALIDDKTQIIFLVHPNNPTGTYLPKLELIALLTAIPTHIKVVMDEAYAEFVMADDYVSGISLLENFNNLIVTRTFSKAYGLAGLRVGYALCSAQLATVLYQQQLVYPVNQLAICAAIAALADQAHLQLSLEHIHRERMRMQTVLATYGISVLPTQSNFITCKFNHAKRLASRLAIAGVYVMALDHYGLADYIRVSIGSTAENNLFISELARVYR